MTKAQKEDLAKELFPKDFEKDPEKFRGQGSTKKGKVTIPEMKKMVEQARVGRSLLHRLQ